MDVIICPILVAIGLEILANMKQVGFVAGWKAFQYRRWAVSKAYLFEFVYVTCQPTISHLALPPQKNACKFEITNPLNSSRFCGKCVSIATHSRTHLHQLKFAVTIMSSEESEKSLDAPLTRGSGLARPIGPKRSTASGDRSVWLFFHSPISAAGTLEYYGFTVTNLYS